MPNVLMKSTDPWCAIPMTREEAQWWAGRELRHALRYHGPNSKQAEEAAKAMCRAHGGDSDLVVRKIVTVDFKPSTDVSAPWKTKGFVEVRAWQDLILQAAR